MNIHPGELASAVAMVIAFLGLVEQMAISCRFYYPSGPQDVHIMVGVLHSSRTMCMCVHTSCTLCVCVYTLHVHCVYVCTHFMYIVCMCVHCVYVCTHFMYIVCMRVLE